MKKIMTGSMFVFLVLGSFSCSKHYINVRTEYLDRTYLASQQIETPDPNRDGFFGQKAVVRWFLPGRYRLHDGLTLVFSVRYGTLEVETIKIPISSHRGIWTYYLLNDDYCQKQGMSAYKVEIFEGETPIATWIHHIWVEMITIDNED